MQRHWFKGDTHLHTLNSDGHLHQYELIERCKKLGLDYIIITDHNYDTVEKKLFKRRTPCYQRSGGYGR